MTVKIKSYFLGKPALLYSLVFLYISILFNFFPLKFFALEIFSDEYFSRLLQKDFGAYWVGARTVIDGSYRDLFCHKLYQARIEEYLCIEAFTGYRWLYPPHFLLFIWPLGLIEYKLSLLFFLISSFAIFIFSVVCFRKNYSPESDKFILLISLIGFSIVNFIITQTGFLTTAALLLGFRWMKSFPLISGVFFGFLTFKPQLGILIPLLLIFEKNFKAIFWSIFFTSFFVIISILFFGSEIWHLYLTDTTKLATGALTGEVQNFFKLMPTVYGSLRVLDFSVENALRSQVFVSLISIIAFIYLFFKDNDILRRSFYLTGFTFLISPYAFVYDMGAFTVFSAIIAGKRKILNGFSLAVVCMGVTLAPMSMYLSAAKFPLSPIVLIASIIAVYSSKKEKPSSLFHVGKSNSSLPAMM